VKRFALILLAATCASVSLADNAQAVRKTLNGNYKAISAAFVKRDAKTISDLMTDDYTATPLNGPTLTKAQIMQDMQRQMSSITNASWIRTITSLKLTGKNAIAVVKGNFQGTITGPDSKPHQFKLDALTTDTWLKTAKGYRLQKSVVSKNDVTVDGKKMGGPR